MSWPPAGSRLATIGRFLPPTSADALILSFASSWLGELTVFVLASPADPISPDLRRRWIGDLVPAARVVLLPGAAAGSPASDTHAAPWRLEPGPTGAHETAVDAALAGSADILVGPGLRDVALARSLGLQYVPVDVPRELPDLADLQAVRSPVVSRVVVMGPESTGKTTLARDLARHYQTVWVSEYLRIWLDAKGAVCEPEDLPKVVAGHQASEAALARFANRVLFCDTDPLMTAVYSGFYYGEVPAWLDEAASARRADAYLLLDADVPWIADPQRDMPHRRDEIRDLCRAELERRSLPWTLVRGTWAERFDLARGIVEALLR